MSLQTKRELMVAIGERYRAADRKSKKAILNEFAKVTGYLIVFAQLAHGSNVRFLSSLRETSELQTLDHSLSQFSHGYTSRNEELSGPVSLDRITGPFYGKA